MEETSSNPEQNLERLLLTRSFAELSEEEKRFVLSLMKVDEYEVYREAVTASRHAFANEFVSNQPDPEILDRLLTAIPQNHKSRRYFPEMFRSFITFRIPVYQPALAVAALLIGFFFLPGKNYETARYIARTDTVYLERKQPVPDANQPQTVRGQSSDAVPVAEAGHDNQKRRSVPVSGHRSSSHDQYVRGSYEKIRLLALNRGGSSARDDSSLMRLLVAAN